MSYDGMAVAYGQAAGLAWDLLRELEQDERERISEIWATAANARSAQSSVNYGIRGSRL